MYYLIEKETEGAVYEHFESLEINGVGFETTNQNVIWVKGNKYSRQYLTFVSKANNNTFGWRSDNVEIYRTITSPLTEVKLGRRRHQVLEGPSWQPLIAVTQCS